jgi:hypothetical protein
VTDSCSHHVLYNCKIQKMDYDVSYDIYPMLGNEVVHSPTNFISHTIPSEAQLGMDLMHPLWHIF